MQTLSLRWCSIVFCLLIGSNMLQGRPEISRAAFIERYQALLPLNLKKQLSTYGVPLSRLLRWARGEQSRRELADGMRISYGVIFLTEKGASLPNSTVSIEELATIVERSPQEVRNLIAIEKLIEHYRVLKARQDLPPLSVEHKKLFERAAAFKQRAEVWAAKSPAADSLLGAMLTITPEDLDSYRLLDKQTTAKADKVIKNYAQLIETESAQAVDAVLEEYLVARNYDLNSDALRILLQSATDTKQQYSSRQLSFSSTIAKLISPDSEIAIDRLTNFTKPFAAYLREARGTRLLVPTSKHLGIYPSGLLRYENGENFPRKLHLQRLSKLLDLDQQTMLETINLEKIIKKYDYLRTAGKPPLITTALQQALDKASAARIAALAKLGSAELGLSKFWQNLQATSTADLQEFQHTFGTYLWMAMQDKGYDANSLHRLTGIKPAWIEKCLRGVSFPSPLRLQQLAETLGLSTRHMSKVIAAEKAIVSYHFFAEVRHTFIPLPATMQALLQHANTLRLAQNFQQQLITSGFTHTDFMTFQPFTTHLEDALFSKKSEYDQSIHRWIKTLARECCRNNYLPSDKKLQEITANLGMDFQAMQRMANIERILLTYSRLQQQHPGFAAQLPVEWQQVLDASQSRTATIYFISQSGRMLRSQRVAKQYTLENLALEMQDYFSENTSLVQIEKNLTSYEQHKSLPTPQIRHGLAKVLDLHDAELARVIANDQATRAAQRLLRKWINLRLSVAELNSYQRFATYLHASLEKSGLSIAQVATALADHNKIKTVNEYTYHLDLVKLYLKGEKQPEPKTILLLQRILPLDLQLISRTVKIGKYLDTYQKLSQKHILPLPPALRQALDHALGDV